CNMFVNLTALCACSFSSVLSFLSVNVQYTPPCNSLICFIISGVISSFVFAVKKLVIPFAWLKSVGFA
ncbi:TPA: hypothetical protein ACKLRZ_002147, partial [Neisseria gonorrhoeae]